MGYGVCQYVPSTEEPLLQGCWTIPHLQHGWMKERVEVRAQVKVGVHECNCATLSREWGGAYDGSELASDRQNTGNRNGTHRNIPVPFRY